jgi:choline dehydrogenase
MVPMARSKVTTNENVVGSRPSCLTDALTVGFHGNHSLAAQRFIEACTRAGIPLSVDLNTPRGTLGVAKVSLRFSPTDIILTFSLLIRQLSEKFGLRSEIRVLTVRVRSDVHCGRRVSTESAYLTSAVLSRPNLMVAVNAHVTRIVFDTTGSIPRAVGVEFSSSRDLPRFRVRAKKQVILSYVGFDAIYSLYAYSSSSQGRGCPFTSCWSLRLFCYKYEVESVQILMPPGIGPAVHLAEHNIPVVAHSPGVGEHLVDHAVIDVAVAETSGSSLNFLKPTTSWHWIKRIYALLTYALTGKGPCTTNFCCPCCAASPRPTTS